MSLHNDNYASAKKLDMQGLHLTYVYCRRIIKAEKGGPYEGFGSTSDAVLVFIYLAGKVPNMGRNAPKSKQVEGKKRGWVCAGVHPRNRHVF